MKIKTRRYIFYYLLRLGAFFVELLPLRAASLLGGACGRAAFYTLPYFRNLTLAQLRSAFPEKSETEVRRIARRAFSNVTANFTELMHVPGLSKIDMNSWIIPHGGEGKTREKIDNILSRGKGFIGLTAHFGNWELIGPYMKMKGYNGVTLARKLYFYKYDGYIRKLRTLNETETIDREASPKKILRVLRENKILGMLADQDIDSVDGVFVEFFGKPAYTPTAPVKLAMASGAPIVPSYMVRNGNKYICFIDEPIYVEAGDDKEDAVKRYTQKWTSVLESYIRKYPDQWVWMHRRWKTRQK